MSERLAIIIDFDNTITTVDVGDALADRFGDPRWREMEAAHERGEVSLRDLLGFMFESMHASREEIISYAVSISQARPGFRELIARAHERGARVLVASGGLDVYVEAVLASLGVDLEVRANRAICDGDTLRVQFYTGKGCGQCGNCKAVVVDDLRAQGYERIVAVGDGTSDRCMARVADVTFARGSLLERCQTQGLAAVAFTDFFDIERELFED